MNLRTWNKWLLRYARWANKKHIRTVTSGQSEFIKLPYFWRRKWRTPCCSWPLTHCRWHYGTWTKLMLLSKVGIELLKCIFMCILWHVWLYLKIRTVVLKRLFNFDVLLTVHLSIILIHKFLFYNKFIIFFYKFRALLCSSSGGQIVLYSIWYRHTP